MATFVPPTHSEYMAPPGGDRLWSWVSYQRGHTVLINPLWTTTPYPGLQVVDSDDLIAAQTNGYAYLGSSSYQISAEELVALVEAGYGGYITEQGLVVSAAGKGVAI